MSVNTDLQFGNGEWKSSAKQRGHGRGRGRGRGRGSGPVKRGGEFTRIYVKQSHVLLMKNISSEYDQIGFKEYLGECQVQERDVAKSEPYIINPSEDNDGMSLAEEEFRVAFDRQLQELRKQLQTHDDLFGFAVRFGKLYIRDAPPFALTHIKFKELLVSKNYKERIKSSFIPAHVDGIKAETYLKSLGFTESTVEEEKEVEEWFVNVLTKDGSGRTKIVLDNALKFKELSPPDQKWLRVDIKCDGDRDVRFVVQSFSHVNDVCCDEFKDRPILAFNEDNPEGVEVCHYFRNCDAYVRHKKQRTFRRLPSADYPEIVVEIATVRELAEEVDGEFMRPLAERCEVVFHPIVENINDLDACEFLRNYMWKFCLDFAEQFKE